MINPLDPYTLAGQISAAEKVHDVLQHRAGVQQQHLAHQNKEQTAQKSASVTPNTAADGVVIHDEAGRREGGRQQHAHQDAADQPDRDDKAPEVIPEVEEGKVIDIKI